MRGCDRRRQVSQKQRLTGFDQTGAANYLDSVSIAVPQAIDADGIRFLANDFFQSRLQCNQLRGIQQNLNAPGSRGARKALRPYAGAVIRRC